MEAVVTCLEAIATRNKENKKEERVVQVLMVNRRTESLDCICILVAHEDIITSHKGAEGQKVQLEIVSALWFQDSCQCWREA